MNNLSSPRLQRYSCWSLDKWSYPTLYWECDYLSMLGYKLIHVDKTGPWCYVAPEHQQTQWWHHHDLNMTKISFYREQDHYRPSCLMNLLFYDIPYSMMEFFCCHIKQSFDCISTHWQLMTWHLFDMDISKKIPSTSSWPRLWLHK